MNTWVNNLPEFECDQYNRDMLVFSPWSGHRNFIYDLVNYYKPEKIVELGSYYGCSAFAILQAIKDNDLATEFYAIDTWAGDDFTAHDYEKNVYDAYLEINTKCYEKQNSTMLRMTFDEAVEQFEDASVDVLHIDGSHHYEDAKHDYETWKNKVKEDGIILFHDISLDKVLGEIMGSHVFWEELKKSHPYTCEFDFSFGLGIMFQKKETYDDFVQKVNMKYYQRLNNELSVNYKDVIRKNHFEIESKKEWIAGLEKDKNILIEDNNRLVNEIQNMKDAEKEWEIERKIIKENYEKTIQEKDEWIKELESTKELMQQENEKIKENYEKTIQEKDEWIKGLESTKELMQQENEKIKENYEKTIQEKDEWIKELESTKELMQQENEKIKENYEKTIQKKDEN